MLVRKSARRVLFVVLTAALALTACNMGATPAPTIDINAINTAAFNTAAAQISSAQTQTALAAPSVTPLATNTALSLSTAQAGAVGSPAPGISVTAPTVFSFNATPNTTPGAAPIGLTPLGSPAAVAATPVLGDACHNNEYVADVTIPDGTIFVAGNDKGLRPGDDFQKIWRIKNTGTCTWDTGYQLVFIGGNRELDPVNFKIQHSHEVVEPGETTDIGVSLTAPTAAGKYTGTWRMQTDNGQFFGTPLTIVIEVQKKAG